MSCPERSATRLASDFLPNNFPDLKEEGNALVVGYCAVRREKPTGSLWSTVGLTNMDFWSFSSNDEVNTVILSPEFAVEMEKIYTTDLGESDEVPLQEWKKRPLSLNVKEWFSHLYCSLVLDGMM
jgi:hypothetical protein